MGAYRQRFGLTHHPLPRDAAGSSFFCQTRALNQLGKRFEVGGGAIVARVGLGDGRGSFVGDLISGNKPDLAKAALVSLTFNGLGLPGLHFGLSAMYERIRAEPVEIRPALPDQPMTEWLAHGHLVYRGPQLTVLCEGGFILHQAAGMSWLTWDTFLIASYSLESIPSLTPYLGVEVQQTSKDRDPFFAPGPDQLTNAAESLVEAEVGLRYDLARWTSLKLEYRLLHMNLSANLKHTVQLNWSFAL